MKPVVLYDADCGFCRSASSVKTAISSPGGPPLSSAASGETAYGFSPAACSAADLSNQRETAAWTNSSFTRSGSTPGTGTHQRLGIHTPGEGAETAASHDAARCVTNLLGREDEVRAPHGGGQDTGYQIDHIRLRVRQLLDG